MHTREWRIGMDSLAREIRREIYETLGHLYDHAYLETHGLAQRLAAHWVGSVRTRAQELRRVLLDAIEQLNPGDLVSRRAPERRAYTILFELYVEGKSAEAVADSLGIGPRQLRRDRAAALDALATIVVDRYFRPENPPPPLPTQASPRLTDTLRGESLRRDTLRDDTLRDESLRLAQQPEPIHLPTFVARLIALLDGLAQSHGVVLRSAIDGPFPVLQVNPTLLRQVLLSLCSQLIAHRAPASIVFEAVANEETQAVGLRFCFASPEGDSRAWHGDSEPPDFATMVAAMGATLVYEAPSAGEQRIWLRLKPIPYRTVLVVDDKDELFALFQRFLTGHPYRLIHAQGVGQALGLLAQERPHIVLLDLMMPDADGWELLQILRQDDAYRDLPVIICSVLHEPVLAQALGARHYLKKPVTADDLVQALATVA